MRRFAADFCFAICSPYVRTYDVLRRFRLREGGYFIVRRDIQETKKCKKRYCKFLVGTASTVISNAVFAALLHREREFDYVLSVAARFLKRVLRK